MILKNTMAIITKGFISLSFLLLLASNVYAVNMQYLKYSPVASFTAEDFEMLQMTGLKALNDNGDGKTSEWKNPETSHSGSITPLDTSEIDGNHCRKVKIINQAIKKYGESTFTFCKVKGKWKVLK